LPDTELDAMSKNKTNLFKGPHDEDLCLTTMEELKDSFNLSAGKSSPQPSAGRIQHLDVACEVTFERKCDQRRHYKSKHLGTAANLPVLQAREREDQTH